eukprot:TRINITY_DN1385_c0_g1_i2.p1 TRINITY_DN1385_c0_g1~~TRINITY_DN1385_c0_g1_i2.p1  ORF type:complete len:467 (-),score=97.31 TRINITY_DN1385_c0_g1_i2:689-2002(-)
MDFDTQRSLFLITLRKAHATGSLHAAKDLLISFFTSNPQLIVWDEKEDTQEVSEKVDEEEDKMDSDKSDSINFELNAEAKVVFEHVIRVYLEELFLLASKKDEQAKRSGFDKDFFSEVGIELLIDMALWLVTPSTAPSSVAAAGASNTPSPRFLSDNSLPLYLFQDLFESQTIENCKRLFKMMEDKREQLNHVCFPKGRLLLLRICIELLRRLSKSNDTVFCGRILMFLTNVFPLSDKSGLNLKSEINTANVTECETPAEFVDEMVDGDEENAPINYQFYARFWKLQRYFQNPSILTKEENWKEFIQGMEQMLSVFSSNSVEADTDSKESDDKPFDEKMIEELDSNLKTYFTKYLTSSRLIRLQFQDPMFRRHILVQALIMFHTLQVSGTKVSVSLSEDKKELMEKLQKDSWRVLAKTSSNSLLKVCLHCSKERATG